MSSARERIVRQERIDRATKLARTFLQKVENYLYPYRGDNGEIVQPSPPTYWHQQLLDQALDTAYAIVEALPNDFFDESYSGDMFGLGSVTYNLSDDVLARVEKLAALLDARRRAGALRRRISALENVTGRTPEEADAYRAKAAELRAKGAGE